LDKGIFKILSDEILSFYEIIGVIAMETLGSEWIKEQKEKEVRNRSEIYKIITILGATGEFKKVILYEGKKIESYVPENGFSKNFLTFAFDIFCLRHQGELPQSLIERLKHFDQYQGARYELAVAAIFCRLGYDIEWFDDRDTKEKHPEFIARKNGEEIYVEAKSRHIKGVHNTLGVFDEIKAFKSTIWGSLIFSLKSRFSAKQFIIFIDMNAINDRNLPPKWLETSEDTSEATFERIFGKETIASVILQITTITKEEDRLKRGLVLFMKMI
jgi:hypothetical protein